MNENVFLQDEVLSLEEILAEGSPLGADVSSTTQADVHSSFSNSGNGKRSVNDATSGLNSRLSKTQMRKLQVHFQFQILFQCWPWASGRLRLRRRGCEFESWGHILHAM